MNRQAAASITVAVHHRTAAVSMPGALPEAAKTINPRTQRMLDGRIAPTLLRMAAPTIAMMVAQSSISLIQVWFVSRLGIDSLAGIALVFPCSIMMQMLSAGSLGGGISSAVARALGAGRRADADALVWHVVIISLAIGVIFGGSVLLFGRPMYRALGGVGGSLEAALLYSNLVFLGAPLTWLNNGLASVIRGTGNMVFPSMVALFGVLALIPLSPLLIFGLGPIPAMGIAGAAITVLVTNVATTGTLCWYLLSGHAHVRLGALQLRWAIFANILRAGTVASVSALQTSFTVILLTALVGRTAGPDAVAGYGMGVRLEFLLLPLVFGLGAPLVAMVGTNIGAGRRDRAIHAALTGGAVAFVLCEGIGIAAAIWPDAWLGLFSHDRRMMAAGVDYLRFAGPGYGFFGLGLALFFASQGAGSLGWPLFTGFLRMVIAVGGGWIAWLVTHDLRVVFAMLCAAWVVYGSFLAIAVGSGVWFRRAV